MRKQIYLSLFLVMVMLLSALAGCAPQEIPENTTQGVETDGTEETGKDETDTGEKDTGEEDTDVETGEIGDLSALEGDALLVENAYQLKNGVNAYFSSSERTSFVFENLNMQADYRLKDDQLLAYLKNKDGKSYLENTMDVFATTTDGTTFYASNSPNKATANIYRFGYYFYEMRFEEQVFIGNFTVTDGKSWKHSVPDLLHECTSRVSDATLHITNDSGASDPRVVFQNNMRLSTDKFKALEITMKADKDIQTGQIFVKFDKGSFNANQQTIFNITGDGEYHTYQIPIFTISDFAGDITGIRLDIGGAGKSYSIKGIRFLEADVEGQVEGLSIARIFNTYSDKLHQEAQFSVTKEINNVAEVGIETKIKADTVAKLIAKDKNGEQDSIDNVDWASAEYVGFDIKDAGIFGYILPYDNNSGRIEVSLEGEYYVIRQIKAVENNTLKVSPKGTNNANDLFIGNRIYTDAAHDFKDFLHEAYCERNPLKEQYIRVDEDSSHKASYLGYDALRGCYSFKVESFPNFNPPFYNQQNTHFRVSFNALGDVEDRRIYILTAGANGNLECAAMLDKNDVMLPVPLEVGKNFSEKDGERNLYNTDDVTYSEVIFPMVIKAKSRDNQYTVLNLYQNWGNYPLKQISWIQFHAPYYHLSTGVTETNCIVPWYPTKTGGSLNTLPDFRSMSAPYWAEQPQHNSCGTHHWLEYTDSNGKYSASENIRNEIDSYGPTYADIKMDYISYDGKIKVTYIHSEMPQTDENRSYYEISYEVLEDISIKDFGSDFRFYSVRPNDPTGIYHYLGYLDENNECKVVNSNTTTEPVEYVLGDACPYFSCFDMKDTWSSTSQQGYSNVALLIYNSEFIIGGEKTEPSFMIRDGGQNKTISLTLDLEEVTLKKGDSFKINAILLPWGSQASEYPEDAPDSNVRNVRNDTLLSPLTLTAGENCEKIESVYIPKAKTTNGESAEFTLSGGNNNVTVRIYGFDKLTVPKVYEKLNGEWVEYDLSSEGNPDNRATEHHYDGYCVHYDGNGKYSYSFVTTMENGAQRTFKIVADGVYDPWEPERVVSGNRENYLNVYIDSVELADVAVSAIGAGECESADGYIRIYGDGKSPEAYLTAFKDNTDESGHYAVVKYRLPNTNTERVARFEFFTSTVSNSAAEDNSLNTGSVESDGEWKTLVIDLSKTGSETFRKGFTADENGKYTAKFFRFDFFWGIMTENTCIDIEYIGLDSDLDKIMAHAKTDCKYITLVEGNSTTYLDTATGEAIVPEKTEISYVSPDSEYKQSSLPYAAYLDFVNGEVVNNGCGTASDILRYSLNKNAIADKDVENCANFNGTNLVFAGWAVIEGGISGYKWSVDGGKTWQDCTSFNLDTIRDASAAMLEFGSQRAGITLTDADKAGASFQGKAAPNPTGLCADLSGYEGKTVNVILAAVPASDEGTLRPFAYVTGVEVLPAE